MVEENRTVVEAKPNHMLDYLMRGKVMPMLIEHIDAIARKAKRDVLFVVFRSPVDWQENRLRKQVCQWLDDHKVPWRECGPVADEHCMASYQGEIYIDVPFDEANPTYQKIQDYLENSNGTMRDPNVVFCCLRLDVAMRNAHHDEPGFWEKWAETF